ncbi:hypothetical protein [Streptomyces sp. NBC_01187]|uniref:hypothetical protein n=1 Tax=Streptomyces sp. NBC_01187 TaxID=2903766 RepID=UPI003866DCEF
MLSEGDHLVLTFEMLPRLAGDLRRLTPDQQRRFRRVITTAFVPDLRTGAFRTGLRVHHVHPTRGVWEVTWAPDGRATWHYGPERTAGHRHIVWRRVGSHSILTRP